MPSDEQPDRAGAGVGVHSLDHFCLQVPDLAVAKDFYTAFGLEIREAGATLELYTAGHPHCWGVLREGARKRLHYVSFGAFASDLPRFRERLKRQAISLAEPPRDVESEGLWFHDRDGALLEIRAAEKSSPAGKAAADNRSSPAGMRSAPIRGTTSMVRPRRLSHALFFARDIPRTIDFYTDVLGLRLSDEAQVVAFLHGVHGSDHHLIAFAKSHAAGFHHASWDTASINEVGLGAQQMADRGYRAGWGLGRHVLGSNYFHYVRDPWGSYCEYSHDIDYIAAGATWAAGHVSPENGFYLWGPAPPQDFAANLEAIGDA
jgi:catechol 2,3-dioxygenase